MIEKIQDKISICPMTLDDIHSIELDFSEKFDKFWSVDILKSDFENNQSFYFVAKIQNEVVGFAGIKVVLDTADIMNIVVQIDKRNLGIGSLLLESLLNKASSLDCSRILLEVNEKNKSAINLYKKYNFHQIGCRKKYYNQTDDAIIMEKESV